MIFLFIIVSYIILSFLFFKYPHLIHKNKGLKKKCHHISHRGGAGENLENTISAFTSAVKMGTDMLELDVHLTKDEQVVVFHDSNLFRATGIDANVEDLFYRDLPLLKVEMSIDFNESDCCKGGKDRKIPLLREVFHLFPNVMINLDIKVDNDILIQKVNTLIKEYQREKLCVWGNISSVITSKCYSINPTIPIFFTAKRVIMLLILTYTGLLPFFPIKESCLELMLPSVAWKHKHLRHSLETSWNYTLFLWLMKNILIRRFLFEHLEKRGIQCFLWVLNSDEHFEEAKQLGVTGIMTDYPALLRSFLDQHGMNYQKLQ